MKDAGEKIQRTVGTADGASRDGSSTRTVRDNDELRKAWVESLDEKQKLEMEGVNPAEVWPFQTDA